jgi:acyl-CoA synthetase (AMP-forming)/AMP-acid ligase II
MSSLVHPDARLVDAQTGAVLGGAELSSAVAAVADAYAALPAGAVFLRIPTDMTAILRYLGAWTANRPVALLDPGLAATTLEDLIARFQPAVVAGLDADPVAGLPARPDGYDVTGGALGPAWVRSTPVDPLPHEDLGVLLATSGSTGSPKLVRLSRQAVLANARAIAEVLRIDGGEVAPTTLSVFYSYGMSVLNSHLMTGATVLVESGALITRPFWVSMAQHGATSMAGVPYQYEMLRRLKFRPAEYPRLRTLTQAGGRLSQELIVDFHQRMTDAGGRMYVMYGQTEAGPRMTTLPSERLHSKLGSVGPALPGGRLSVRLADGTETTDPGVSGEILYRGPNVMLGYAESAADLARGDENGGLLETGDLGQLDDEGYLFLQGRLKRIGKVFGVRLNLDDVESMVAGWGAVAAVSKGDTIVLFAERADDSSRQKIASSLADQLNLHRSGFDVRSIDALPLLGNGKVDYRTLEGSA